MAGNIKILITDGAGFIGSHVIRRFVNSYSDYYIYNLDLLDYAGNLQNLIDIESYENYSFLHGNICDETYVNSIFKQYKFVIPTWLDALKDNFELVNE